MRRAMRPRGTTQRRRRVWARHIGASDILTLAGIVPGAIDLLATFRATAGTMTIGLTVARIRVDLQITKTAGAGAGLGDWGIQVANQAAEAVDIDPSAGVHQDWMAWGALPFGVTVGSSINYCNVDGTDVKSMRRIDEVDQTLWFCGNTNLAANTLTVNVRTSVLLLLP